MTESKHTPGPWIIQYGSLSNHCCFEYSVCGEDIEDDIVAEILGGDDRSEANAHLIAAAPDLLEEHEDWSELLGEVKVALLQEDGEGALQLLECVDVVFGSREDGRPSIKSAAIRKARGLDE